MLFNSQSHINNVFCIKMPELTLNATTFLAVKLFYQKRPGRNSKPGILTHVLTSSLNLLLSDFIDWP